jgi:defect-in-organelle-trafficking protein DotD
MPSVPKLVAAILAGYALSGCAMKVPIVVDVPGMPNPERAMQESFARVDAEMNTLRGVSWEKAPRRQSDALPVVVPAELDKVVSFAWNGSLEGAVEKLATSIGYKVSVNAPASATQISIVLRADEPRRIYDLFEAIGGAAGDRATVKLDTQHQMVEVIYHVAA